MSRFLLVYLAILLLTSCGSNISQISSANEYIDGKSIEWITPVDSIDTKGMNLYWKNDNIQFAGDDNAILLLYVQADKAEDGSFIFDDGQDWLLFMKTSYGYFPLFPRTRVQLGKVSCVVFNDYNNDSIISHVLVTIAQSAAYQIYDCVYDIDEKAFKIVPVYNVEDINYIM